MISIDARAANDLNSMNFVYVFVKSDDHPNSYILHFPSFSSSPYSSEEAAFGYISLVIIYSMNYNVRTATENKEQHIFALSLYLSLRSVSFYFTQPLFIVHTYS